MPKVSVVIPVYRVEKTLRRCVDSVISQTLDDLEIILVDDGSPDRCPEICDEYAVKDCRIRVIHKENAGLGWARNSGLDAATGEYVGFVDSDDSIAENTYEDFYHAAKKYCADAVYGGINYVHNGKITPSQFEREVTVYRGRDEMKRFLMHHLTSSPTETEDSRYGATATNAIFSMDLIRRHNIRFLSERDYISEDSIFGVDLLSKASCGVMLPGHYYFYDYNPASLTSSYRPDRFEKNKKLYQLISEKLMEFYGDQEAVRSYGRYFLSAARVCAIQEALNGDGIRGIRKISSDPLLRAVLKDYPWTKLPFKKRLFTFCVYSRLHVAQYLLIRLMKVSK